MSSGRLPDLVQSKPVIFRLKAERPGELHRFGERSHVASLFDGAKTLRCRANRPNFASPNCDKRHAGPSVLPAGALRF